MRVTIESLQSPNERLGSCLTTNDGSNEEGCERGLRLCHGVFESVSAL